MISSCGCAEELELLVEPVLGEGLAERRDEPGRRREERADAVLARLEPERDGEMGLADAGRAEQQDVLAALDDSGRWRARG